ncbi:MAG: hypothetical protein J2P17_00070 [Mycobacterium sp.]|nr:hypothetical protein [Mycobacterium sp.]
MNDSSPSRKVRRRVLRAGTRAPIAVLGGGFQHRHPARRRPGAGALIAAMAVLFTGAAVLVTGCAGPAPPALPAPPDPAGASVAIRSPTVTATGELGWAVADVDATDPDAVLVAAAGALYSYAPAVDDSPAQAFDRSRPLLSRSYQQRVGASTTGLARCTGATWQRWRADRAAVTARAMIGGDDHPPDTAITHRRVVTVTETVHSAQAGSAGTTVDPIMLYMTAGRHGATGTWRVIELAVR